ncbi:ATP-binding protein [Acinetobacter baumannii]|uniref:ATP-binding protein n=1 Tax=Acinetobacter baumannii TaxID=470 RepID=UPI00259DF469|nr:ATP-binding protein [Acinetobacter baumannii]EKW3202918.1 ATP-binding protein [Acinetobacter baumannii]EKX0107496.1 ATP-binding protein [Acinetobacter baumannii]ELB5354696.1 ATP-binding protein [Acinetobacter baumannii]HAV2962751.1 ATP-binding protein [Acinetobacter baumannii]
MQVSIGNAAQLIKEYLKADIVPFIIGSPAIGKSSIVKSIADAAKLKLIDVRVAEMDPTDIAGFPIVENERSFYAPPTMFPLVDDEIPDGYHGWLLFLDELPNAPAAVQNVTYRLILDRMIGQKHLHENVFIVAAGNKDTDNCHTESLSSALISRMAVFEVYADPREWCEYASSVEADYRIIGLINWRGDLLYTFNPESADPVYASPRTWMMADRLINKKSVTDETVKLLAPLISEGVAREFVAFSQIFNDLPSISKIIQSPKGTPVPDRMDIKWATLTAVAASATEDNIDKLVQYIDRFPGEYRVVCMKQIGKRNPKLLETKTLEKWFEDNAEELI